MKLQHRTDNNRMARTEVNNQKRNFLLIGLIAAAIALIIWIVMVGKQAERTIPVCMLAQDVYKNQVITSDMLVQYDMIEAEFEKYAITKSNGSKARRIVLWKEKDALIGAFAAYPLQNNTVAMYDNFITERVDNSDSVLYSFPGKEIVAVDIVEGDLDAYKTFLQPGDRVNITAVYNVQAESDEKIDGERYQVDTVRTETLFEDIMVADLLNQDGNSILDIYATYNDMTVYEQAAMDKDEEFQDSVSPASLLLALTQDEIQRYYEAMSKNCTFKMSLPQRVE